MNKQEAIEKIKDLYSFVMEDGPFEVDLIKKGHAVGIISQIDEPEKPVVPHFVADWYEEHKDNFEIYLSELCINFTCHRERLNDKLANWYEQLENKPIQTLVNMHQFGYEVEKEKLYLASFRDTNQYLGWNEKLGEWFMSCSPFTSGVEQTRETWEGVGIWNNPAFEIKKAEE